MLNSDNLESREAVEYCYKQNKTVLNPIIDWTDSDVWEFIEEYHVPYCELYDKGFKRIGCIGCPLSTRQAEELEMYPKYKENYLRAFERTIKINSVSWKTPEEVMNWWVRG